MNFSAADIADSLPLARASRRRAPWLPARDRLALVAAFFATFLVCGPVSAQTSPFATDTTTSTSTGAATDLPSLRRPLDLIARADAREQAVLVEVRRGVERLARTCTAPPAPAASAPGREAVLLQPQREASELRARLVNRNNRLSDAARVAVGARCTGLSFIPGIKSPECRTAEALRDASANVQKILGSYFDAIDSRYRLYRDVRELEDRGCARPGFTQRLIQADDASMRPQEAAAQAAFEEFLRAADEAAATLR